MRLKLHFLFLKMLSLNKTLIWLPVAEVAVDRVSITIWAIGWLLSGQGRGYYLIREGVVTMCGQSAILDIFDTSSYCVWGAIKELGDYAVWFGQPDTN